MAPVAANTVGRPPDDGGRPAAPDRLLLRAARRSGWSLGALLAAGLVLAGTELALPAVLGRAMDGVVAGSAGAWVLVAAVLVAVLAAADSCDDVATGVVTARATAWLRRSMFRRFLAAGPAAGRTPAGDLASRMVGGAATAGRAAPDVVRAVANVAPAVGAVVALALIDPWLAVAFLAGMPLLALLLRSFVRDASDMAAGYLDAQARIAGRLVDAVEGGRTVAAAGTAGLEARRVLEPLPELRRFGMGTWRAQVRLVAQDALLLPLLEVVVLAVAGAELSAGRMTAGEVLAASQYVQLASAIGAAASAAGKLARARAGAGRVAGVVDQPVPAFGDGVLPPGPGRLELRAVTVRRDGAALLDRLSIDIPGGTLAALVGRSGSGKSLLAALAGRLVDPDAGEVLLDGVPLPRLAQHEVRREVTYGFERPTLFGDTVEAAVAFGATRPGRADIVAASCAARADEFVQRLPAGYDTPMEAVHLSGGEAQRLGLARTFAHAGRLVVLDDVAANLDTATEHRIGRVLTGRLGGRTRLVVAHRAATAARADLVVWLDGGRVRAVGTHAALWDDPDYRAVFAAGAPEPAGVPVGSPA